MKNDKSKRYIVTQRVTLAGAPRKPKAESNAAPPERPDADARDITPPENYKAEDSGLFEKPETKKNTAPGRQPVSYGLRDEDPVSRKGPVMKDYDREPRERDWDEEPAVLKRKEPRGREPVPAWALILLFAVIAILAAISLYFFVFKAAGASAPEPSETPTETVAPTPSPTPTPTPTPIPTVTPTPDPYFTSDEQVVADMDAGHWSYSSPALWVDINRVYDESKKVTYYAAEVRVKPGSGETERGGFAKPGDPKAKNVKLYVIARTYKAVVAVGGDFLADNIHEDPKGVIIRDGIKCVDHDDEDTVAFMPDGTIKIFEAGEVTADELMAQGVKNSFSFGPTLINDGVIADGLGKHRLRSKNPRTAVGMIEPYHYLLVMVQGRSPEPTNGMTLTELAELLESYGCTVAYNLDGGQSATMAFMGEHISKYGGSFTKQRGVPDALMFGLSDLVTPME